MDQNLITLEDYCSIHDKVHAIKECEVMKAQKRECREAAFYDKRKRVRQLEIRY